MVDDVRDFLFAFNRRGQDLTSINIQRGRDHGLPDLNTVRASIGLPSKNFRILKSLLF
jgi:peroxidase